MEPYAELVSAFLGLLGSLLLAVPYFADFWARQKRLQDIEALNDGTFTREDATTLRGPVDRTATDRVLDADGRMALCAVLGCMFLVLSFAILIVAKTAGTTF